MFFFVGDIEIVATFKHKRYMASTRIFYIIVGKFNYWEEPGLIILLVIDKSSKINFYHTILSLGFAINLMIKGNKKCLLDFQKVRKWWLEF